MNWLWQCQRRRFKSAGRASGVSAFATRKGGNSWSSSVARGRSDRRNGGLRPAGFCCENGGGYSDFACLANPFGELSKGVAPLPIIVSSHRPVLPVGRGVFSFAENTAVSFWKSFSLSKREAQVALPPAGVLGAELLSLVSSCFPANQRSNIRGRTHRVSRQLEPSPLGEGFITA